MNMRIPKGKGIDLTGGLVITVVIDDFVLTGTFLGEIDDEQRRHSKDHDHDHEGHCPPVEVKVEPIKVDVDVDVKAKFETEFILIQLTCPVEFDYREIPAGTVVAINVAEILFIFPGGDCSPCT